MVFAWHRWIHVATDNASRNFLHTCVYILPLNACLYVHPVMAQFLYGSSHNSTTALLISVVMINWAIPWDAVL